MTASNTLSNSPLTLEPTLLKRWTVQDYHRLGEVGILPPGERTEILFRQITPMAARGTPYVTALRLLSTTLDNLLANEHMLVITQDPFNLMISQSQSRIWRSCKALSRIMSNIILGLIRFILWWRWQTRL